MFAARKEMTMRSSLLALFGGMLFLVFGLVLAPTILSQAASSGSSANIGSFAGTQSINDLVPLIYYTVVAIGGIGLIGAGGAGIAGKGPLAN